MSLLLVNLISLGLSAISLIVFFAALRKASRLTAMSRLMANQVASSANNLQQAWQSFRQSGRSAGTKAYGLKRA